MPAVLQLIQALLNPVPQPCPLPGLRHPPTRQQTTQ